MTATARRPWCPPSFCLRAVLMLACGGFLSGVPPAQGSCVMESITDAPSGRFVRHLSTGCTDQEREARAVPAEDLLTALKAGQGIDLNNVVVQGDLLLDRLPVTEVGSFGGRSVLSDEVIRERGPATLRVIAGPISMTHSIVRGTITANLNRDLIVVTGPMTMTGTTFERSIDLSHTLFLESVDFSGTVIGHEGFFIQAVFGKKVDFSKTAFGVHSRFHKAIFNGPATFSRAGFHGLAEFLEVTFRKDARFDKTYFKMGTGFSGSRFQGHLDFSEANFEREAFFTFALFEGDAMFRHATFRAQADFSDAQFKGVDDFSKAVFHAEPKFNRVRVSGARPAPGGLQDPRILYGVAVVLLLFTVLFLVTHRKR